MSTAITTQTDFKNWTKPAYHVGAQKEATTLTFAPPMILPYSQASIDAYLKEEKTRELGDPLAGDDGSGGAHFNARELGAIISATLGRAAPEYFSLEYRRLRFKEKTISDSLGLMTAGRDDWLDYSKNMSMRNIHHSGNLEAQLDIHLYSPENFFPRERAPTISGVKIEGRVYFGLGPSLSQESKPTYGFDPLSLQRYSIRATGELCRALLTNSPAKFRQWNHTELLAKVWLEDTNNEPARIGVAIKNPSVARMNLALREAEKITLFYHRYRKQIENAHLHLVKALFVGDVLKEDDNLMKELGYFDRTYQLLERGKPSLRRKVVPYLQRELKHHLNSSNAALREIADRFPKRILALRQ